jgi:two-component system sensor histidine kinase VicK
MGLRSLRARFLAVTGVVVLPVIVLGAVTYLSFERQLEASRRVRETLDVIVLGRTVADGLARMQRALAAHVLEGDPGARRAAEQARAEFGDTIRRLEGLVAGSPAQGARLGEVRAGVQAWWDGPVAESLRLVEAGQRPLVLLGRQRAPLEALHGQIDQLVQAEARKLAERTRAHAAAQRRTRWLLLAGGALVLAGGVAASVLLRHRVIRPLLGFTAAVDRATAGEAVPPAEGRPGDEIERLGAAFTRMATEAAQREEALDRVRREAETFVEIQRDLSETLELVPLLQKIARHARLLCRSDLVYIAPFDPRAGMARVVALLGERTAALRHLRVEPGRGIAGRVLSSRKPLRVASWQEDAGLREAVVDPVAAEGLVAILAVPMILEQELIGLIFVSNRTSTPFSDHDEAVLQRLAVPAALAIRNARLVSELGQERDLLAVRSRELARSEAQIRGIVQAASDGILTVDPGGHITSVNRAACQMFGYTAQDLLARGLHRLVPTPVDAFEGIGRPGPAAGHEVEGIRRDGSRFPIEMSVSIVRTEHDHFFAVIVRDITERKRAYETRFQLASIVDSTDDAIIGWGPDLRITSWNPGAERVFGYTAAEIIGESFLTLVPPDRRAEPEQFADRIRQGEHVRGRETVQVRKDGSPIDVSVTISATRDEAGRIIGFSTIARDITERKAIERLKDEFLATVSHELRTPLTAIRGHLELVLEGEAGPVTPLQQEFLAVASQSTDRLGALINDLLDVEKIEAGKIQIREEPVDLAEVLRDVVSTFRLEAERKGLAVREAIADRLAVVGDRDRLIQVFANLVSNAIKYTAQGEVGIRAGRRDGKVEVVVRDTGIGISPEEQPQLFTKFFRSQQRQVREAGGTGLGLVIAKGIVERHGGRIGVESEKGVGTRFTVVLP